MRVTPLAARLGSAALVLLLGAGLGACSGGETADHRAANDTSADDSADEPTAVTATEDTTDETSLQELTAAEFYPVVMGALREAESFTFTTTEDALGSATSLSGQARFGDGGIEMSASSTGAQTLELILIDQVMYLKSPDLGTGDHYVRIDLNDPNTLFGMVGRATDPEVMFTALKTPTKLELVGEEEVDGVATNHYRITIDSADYLEAMDLPDLMREFLPAELVTQMWVDGDNLPRKFAQTLEAPAPSDGEPMMSTTEGTYSDFGTDVDISAPPEDQVSTEGLPGGFG